MLGSGYTAAAVSPIGVGAVRDAAGAFGPSLLLIAAGGVAFAVALSAVGRTTASVGEAAPAAEA
jgi:cyanate permease